MEPTTTSSTRMRRPVEGRVLAGVAAAVAERTGIAPWAVRLGFVIATLFGGFGLFAYLMGWILIPAGEDADSPAERWLTALGTPGRRTGALLISIAVLIILSGLAPSGLLPAAALLIVGTLLVWGARSEEQS